LIHFYKRYVAILNAIMIWPSGQCCTFYKAFGFLSLLSQAIALDYNPRHVHLAVGANSSSLIVTWSTLNKTEFSIVWIGITELTEKYFGNCELFVDSGELHISQCIHRVVIPNVKPDTVYKYRVGSDLGWSSLFTTRSLRTDSDWSPVIALFGDMGNENPVSLPYLQKGALEEMFDLVIHVGDFAYDMYEENGRRGDDFMAQIEPVASSVPYMTCPGNHEYHYNFSNYKARFNMPGDDGKMFYSFTVGPIRFISVSTEYYYYYLEDFMVVDQHSWLEKELQKANTAEERKKHPWLVVFGHRPMYCSNNDHDDCTTYETKTRIGFPPFYVLGMEDLLYKYGVDVAVWAHEHSYERLLPLYNKQIMSGADSKHPYTNPGGPVHITSGSAGCREKHDEFIRDPPEWSAFRSTDYGFTIMEVANTTHMHIKQLSTENNLQVVDQFWLIKDKHGPYQSKVYIITMFYPFYMSGAQFLISTMKLTIFVFLIVCLYTLLKSNIRALAYVRSRNLHMQPYNY